MSKLAQKLPPPDKVARVSRGGPGPIGACERAYGLGDEEDWLAVDALRHNTNWKNARAQVHAQLGLQPPTPSLDKFRYHWRGKCRCWSDDLKAWIEAQS